MRSPIAATGRGLKRALMDTYLAGNAMLTQGLIGGRSGERVFSRVIIVAALGKQNGITRGAYLQWDAFRRLGIDVELLDATAALRNPLVRVKHQAGSVYIFHSGGPQTAALIGSVLPQAARAYRIAYWAWELPDPPQDWAGCDSNVDEVWTPSVFSQTSLRRLIRKPVIVVPHYLGPQPARVRDARGPFTVLTMADTRSSLSRKNPAGAVRAFVAAFGPSPSARLLLKLSGRDDEVEAFTAMLGAEVRAANIEIIRAHLDDAGLSALYERADVLLSLHRAEGFGLPMLEALARGIPVVATGWSGNVDFTTEANSVLVPYELVAVQDPAAIYQGSTWAEPDVTAAAEGLRMLHGEPAVYARMAAAALESVSTVMPQFPVVTAPAVASLPH
ncbi:glycosyltransferase [Acidisoma cladoniae]|uniref:glycosyltransferase n=1 Tax=Acidisoma cladoniae TaxID=3040935 RepID=UPI00254DC1B6|nr:glycosyltransferase [Acidisoma sp. PAMC 29798]